MSPRVFVGQSFPGRLLRRRVGTGRQIQNLFSDVGKTRLRSAARHRPCFGLHAWLPVIFTISLNLDLGILVC